MSLASLSPEVRAADLMDTLKVRQDFVSAYCRIEATKLSRALKGTRDLSPEEGKRLVADLTRLLEISQVIEPFKVDLVDARNARRLVDALDGMDFATIQHKVAQVFEQ
jgi:hypothetical protein